MSVDSRLQAVVSGLQRIFGARLEAVVAYGPPNQPAPHCLALVTSLTFDDLSTLATAAAIWHEAGAATPLVVPHDEFAASLDAFPIEYGEIIDTHTPLYGDDPFAGIAIDAGDLRRAVEVQAASLLLHLRENFIEVEGTPADVDRLVHESAPAFAALLRRIARLDGAPAADTMALARWATHRASLDPRIIGDVLSLADGTGQGIDAGRLFPDYLTAVATVRQLIDRWPID